MTFRLNINQLTLLCLALFSLLFIPSGNAKEFLSPEELEHWFNSDEELPANKVNEGQLTFLTTKPKDNIFHSKINININQNSIDNGWIQLTQCYKNLDPIHKTVIVYRKNLIKNLSVTSSHNIKQTHVEEENKIVLNDVSKGATLCMSATVRNFYQNEDKSFSLINGPFHRKFLDGYYPYHLNLSIQHHPKLQYISISPKPQPGFQIKENKNRISLDSWFEGRLKIEFRFKLKTN